jgi:hypothetical protein
MPKMSCCTKASFYTKFCLSFTEGKQLLLDKLHLCCICIGYTMAARGLLVLHEWPVLIGHEGVARVVYQN